MIVCFYLGTGFAGCNYQEDIEFEDDITDEEIENEYDDWVNDRLDKSWWKKEDK